jgi:hypothetical protein
MAFADSRFSSSRAAALNGDSWETRVNGDDAANAAGGEVYGRHVDDDCRGRYG